MTDDGVLTLGQRFQNVELMLTRIDGKLDRKVDLETYAGMVARVENLESGDTPLGRVLLRQFENMQGQVSELITHGSNNAQEAIREIEQVKAQVNAVQTEGAGSRAVIKDKQDRSIRFYKMWGIAITAVAAAGSAVGALSLVLSH